MMVYYSYDEGRWCQERYFINGEQLEQGKSYPLKDGFFEAAGVYLLT